MSTRKLEVGGYLYSPFIDDAMQEHELAHPIIKLTPARVTIAYRGEPLALVRRKLEETGRWDPSPRTRRKLPTFFVEPKEDTLAQRLLAKIEAENRLCQTPDLARFDEYCACGTKLEPWDIAACEACRRARQ